MTWCDQISEIQKFPGALRCPLRPYLILPFTIRNRTHYTLCAKKEKKKKKATEEIILAFSHDQNEFD